MEHSQDHIATLAAAGTLGLAVAGLAVGTPGETVLVKPGKRKSPGADVSYFSNPPSSLSIPTRRTVSQPPTLFSPPEQAGLPRLSTSLFRRKTLRDPEQLSTSESANTQSRGSSLSRYGRQLPDTAAKDGSEARDGSRPRSSWFMRISTIPSSHSSSPASSIMRPESDLQVGKLRANEMEMPNKLVKRATSQRALSTNDARGSFFRRPATSHRRSTSQIPTSAPQQSSPAAVPPPLTPTLSAFMPSWRPYFETGYPRKRHTSETTREGLVKVVSNPYLRQPTLVSPHVVQRQGQQDDLDESRPLTTLSESATSHRRQRLKHSLSNFRKNGRQRNFTDPTVRVFKEDVQGSIVPPVKHSPLSPMSRSSTFNFEMPHGTPVFASSPPMVQHQKLSLHKRISVAQSDLNTNTSSDNDTRVFTDDDSMDFHSDTAYDSLATRATASSHSGFRQPKIETIFDEPIDEHGERLSTSLENLMQRTTLNGLSHGPNPAWPEAVGIGISGLAGDEVPADFTRPRATTPIRNSVLSSIEELNATPVPVNQRARLVNIGSSPPSVLRHPLSPTRMPTVQYPEDMDLDGEDSIEWSPKPDYDPPLYALADESPNEDEGRTAPPHLRNSNKRASIFDWSEQQKDGSNGLIPRPRTVHGKRANDVARSRTPGRKSINTTHLRSQSVPVNRETPADIEATPSAATKFGTWGLGNKPVSEEWSDDFEFEEPDEVKELDETEVALQLSQRDSIQSVKVPQNILDRQASVHLQFGQVQEFMMLVDELKRLRSRGVALASIEGAPKQLWDDAEAIINLATLNEDEDGLLRPSSPSSSDIFGDEQSPSSRRISLDQKRDSMQRRSVSNPSTPPFNRPRGDSLLQARSFLHTIHQNRIIVEAPPVQSTPPTREKKNFDTQDLRDLVIRAGAITRSLKELVRKAEGVSVSPQRTPQKIHDPTFRHIFNPPDTPPFASFRKPGLPKSRSANSYLGGPVTDSNENDLPSPMKYTAVIEAN